MTKHDWVASILWGLSAGFVLLTSTANPTAMGALGFAIFYGYVHKKAQGLRFRGIFAGLFGLLAGWAAMGFLHMDGEKALVMMGLMFFVFFGGAYHIAKGVKPA